MANLRIKMEEWRAEIERVMSKAGDDGLTMDELADLLHTSRDSAAKQLRALHRQGKIAAGRRSVICVDGVTRRLPVYRLQKPSPSNERKAARPARRRPTDPATRH